MKEEHSFDHRSSDSSQTSSDLREREEDRLKKTPEDFTISAMADVNRLARELQLHQIELEMQNEELRKSREDLEESRNKYFDLFEQAPVAYFTINLKGMIQEVNLTGASMLKLERSKLLTCGFSRFVEREYQDLYYLHYKQVLETQTMQSRELRLVDEEGAEIDVKMECAAVLDEHGSVAGIRTTITDITDLKKALAEKELLVKEVYHRVKNNLQVISSLLNLQAARIHEPALKAAFQDSQARVRAMSMVHEALYRSKTLSEINLKPYIRKLAHDLFQTYNTASPRVVLKVNAEDILLNVDEAIPCGLVLNELITNSLKYAFPEDRKGAIILDVRLDDKKNVVLTYSDNGVGLPENFDIRKTDTLGLSLAIKLMERQLGGKMKISRNNGLKYTFTFKPRGG